MNDKIRKLAEEHGFIHEYMTIGERNDALTKYQEFAELIIRELADIAKLQVMNISTYADADFIEKQIIEHFGITE